MSEKDANILEKEDESIIKEKKEEAVETQEKDGKEEVEKKELDLQQKLEDLQREVDNLNGDYLRKNAEFQNFRKRQEKEIEELRKYASEKIIIKLLDSVDNLERAIDAAKTTEDFESLVKGVEMTLTQMKGIMTSEGVEELKAEGEMYNPHIHHGVMTEESDNHENDSIIQVFQKGYKMKEKVIRPAMVKVCKK